MHLITLIFIPLLILTYIVIYIGLPFLIVNKIFNREGLNEFIKNNFPQAKDNPLAVTGLIVATFLWIGFVGELPQILPNIEVFDKWFGSSWYGGGPVVINPIFYSWYLI